jgi:hypothetical protein
MPFKVGVTSGIYYAARTEELSSAVRKLGYTLTRGTSVIELAQDVPHEVTFTEGREIRHIVRKQEVDLLMHGSLTIPMGMPERSDWRDAQDHLEKSTRSAVHGGCVYVNFHACLQIWLELITYAGRKLTMSFCDHEGRFISHILKENAKLREWFIKEKGDLYLTDILDRDKRVKLTSGINLEAEKWRKERIAERLREILDKSLPDMIPIGPNRAIPKSEYIEDKVRDALTTGVPSRTGLPVDTQITDMFENVRAEASAKSAEIEDRHIAKILDEFLSKGEKWYNEELRAVVGIIDGYHIMAHHMFFTEDLLWKEMSRMYKQDLAGYNLNPKDLMSLTKAWKKAEEKNDKRFKEFYYGVVAAKYMEGHMKKLLTWMNDSQKGLLSEFKNLPEKTAEQRRDKKELLEGVRKLNICIETPDARDSQHAGMHLLWSPRQIYAAIKAIRQNLKTDKVWMLMDFEHAATQGVDPIREMEEVIKIAPDFGEYVMAVHSNYPNPMHGHDILELGDVVIYTLLWYLRKTGFGKKRVGYLIFERGGAKDPYAKSVEVLRNAARYLEQDIPPENLPTEYFGVKGPVAGGYKRQEQIVKDHAWEPLKDLLEMPEEEWTAMSQAAIKKGRKPESWKKGELR